MKKILVAVADANNLKLAKGFENSLRKFHDEEELPYYLVTGDELAKYLSDDPAFFYRATPILGKRFLNDYDVVIKVDVDQIVMGNLSYIWEQANRYDVGTVLNINRIDPPKYGLVTTSVIDAPEYFNCGLVAMANKDFVNHWDKLCHSKYFDRLQYREQDLLNIICHFGEYKVKCFDNYNPINGYFSWHGLVAKGETANAYLKGKDVVIPIDKTGYPDREVILKLWHTAGGNNETKVNYRIYFPEEMIKHIDWLIGDKKNGLWGNLVNTHPEAIYHGRTE